MRLPHGLGADPQQRVIRACGVCLLEPRTGGEEHDPLATPARVGFQLEGHVGQALEGADRRSRDDHDAPERDVPSDGVAGG
jgi:hypothetical protein